MPSAERSTKELKAANGENCTITREMREAAGGRKPSKSQKARALEFEGGKG